jgi:hypothetical protein
MKGGPTTYKSEEMTSGENKMSRKEGPAWINRSADRLRMGSERKGKVD